MRCYESGIPDCKKYRSCVLIAVRVANNYREEEGEKHIIVINFRILGVVIFQ